MVKHLFKIVCILLLICDAAQATHIVGGNMSFRCLGGDRYEIILQLRRDCKNGQAQFDNPASVGIFNTAGQRQNSIGNFGVISMQFRQDDTLNEVITTKCGIVGGDVCVHETTYREEVTLPNNGTGYILAYQRCCRNHTINNLLDPMSEGATYSVTITAASLNFCNSSPELAKFPPIYICGGKALIENQEATDVDGDRLVYSLCNPVTGGSMTNPIPSFPSTPPFIPVVFSSPYSVTNFIGGTPAMTMNAQTGVINANPTAVIAQYLVAYCVKEYRNNVLLSESYRDFQLNVRICDSEPIADFDYKLDRCKTPYSIFITDKSKDIFAGINSRSWQLVQNGMIQNSNATNPNFTIKDSGELRIKLVISSNTNCNDTLEQIIPVDRFKPVPYSSVLEICKGDTVDLIKSFDPNNNYIWNPSNTLTCNICPNPRAFPTVTTSYYYFVSDGMCLYRDSIIVLVKPCGALDSCSIAIEQKCLPNGLVEISAYNNKNDLVQPKLRVHELRWSISNPPNMDVVVHNTNPLYIKSNTKVKLESTIYYFDPKDPHTIEYAKICKQKFDITAQDKCNGPCAPMAFILSSCDDDYDKKYNLDYPVTICSSYCKNSCMYIVGLFEMNGKLIDPSQYDITWSTGAKGAYVVLMGPYYNNLSVVVKKGDCIWYGRYIKSCLNFKSIRSQTDGESVDGDQVISISRSRFLTEHADMSNYSVYDMTGKLVSVNELPSNISNIFYYIIMNDEENSVIYKVIGE